MAKPFETLECGRVINPYKTKIMPKQNQPFSGSAKSGVYDYVARRYTLTNCPEVILKPGWLQSTYRCFFLGHNLNYISFRQQVYAVSKVCQFK
jgi:hypothetical protein